MSFKQRRQLHEELLAPGKLKKDPFKPELMELLQAPLHAPNSNCEEEDRPLGDVVNTAVEEVQARMEVSCGLISAPRLFELLV